MLALVVDCGRSLVDCARSRCVATRGDDGQALIEYALILGLIAAVAVATLQLLGPGVASLLSEVEAAFP
jgi:Flp pilus assembly pilin Flp